MANPTKILELKGTDWMKGLSIQSGLALGGLFDYAYNFDPFDTMGYLRGSLAPVTLDASTITTQVKHFTSVAYSADGYVFALGDRADTGTKCFYKIKLLDNTVEDYSGNIDTGHGGAIKHSGMTYHDSKVVYCSANNTIRSVSTTGTSDVEILTSAASGGFDFPVAFGMGADGELYYTNNTASSIGKIVLVTGTAGNVSNAFTIADTSFRPKDITSDGIYTIIVADNNLYGSTISTASCKVFFWDNISSRATIIYDIPDSSIIAARYVNGKVVVIGASGLWVCNSATPPKLIFPLATSKLPTGANQVVTKDGILYWTSPTYVYAYGSKVGKDILFTPFRSTDNDNLHSALGTSGPYFLTGLDTGTNTPKVILLNSGSTRTISQLQSVTTSLPQPYTFSYAKVVLKESLGTGDKVTLSVFNGEGNVVMAATDKSYAVNGAKKTLIFNPILSIGSGVTEFIDLKAYLEINQGETGDVIVQRVSVYGIPQEDYSQKI
jgi:hypothetical protein